MGSGDGLQVVPAAELGLDDGDGVVAGLALPGDHGSAEVVASAAALRAALDRVPATVSVVVLVVAPVDADPDPAGPVERLVGRVRDGGAEVAMLDVPAFEAVKRVRDGLVVESVDRGPLRLLRLPVAVDREALQRALADVVDDRLVNPCRLVAEAGGPVALVSPPPSRSVEDSPR